jgi:hypothetical protein
MKDFKLNKKVVTILDDAQLNNIKGGSTIVATCKDICVSRMEACMGSRICTA